jgi:hypothetical protein
MTRTKKTDTNTIVSKRESKHQKLTQIVSKPQTFRLKPTFFQLWKCIQQQDYDRLLEEYYKPFSVKYFHLFIFDFRHSLPIYELPGCPLLNRCREYGKTLGSETKNHYIQIWGKEFAKHRHTLFGEYLHSLHQDFALATTIKHFTASKKKSFQLHQEYRERAMRTALLCYQYHVPLFHNIFINKITKTSLVASNTFTYHLDLCFRVADYYRFTQSRWNFDSLPVLCMHQSTTAMLEWLSKQFLGSHGFFTHILEYMGYVGILCEPNPYRRSSEIPANSTDWKLFLASFGKKIYFF